MQDQIFRNASQSIDYQFYFDEMVTLKEMAIEIAESERPKIYAELREQYQYASPIAMKMHVKLVINARINKILEDSTFNTLFERCCQILAEERAERQKKEKEYQANFTKSVYDENRAAFLASRKK